MTKYDYALIAFYLILVVIVTWKGASKKQKRWKLFLLNLFLTPIAGIVFYLKSKEPDFKIDRFIISRYKCSRCGYKFDDYHKHCPYCEKEGHLIELEEIKQVMT